MSATRPHCRVCVDPQVQKIDAKLREGTYPGTILLWMKQQKNSSRVVVYTKDNIRAHRRDCLGIRQDGPTYIAPDDISAGPIDEAPAPDEPKLAPPIPTPEDPAERAKMVEQILYSNLAELTPKELLTLHMRELDLKIAQENRLSKQGTLPPAAEVANAPSEFDEAMAAAAGHRPDLRVVGKKKAS